MNDQISLSLLTFLLNVHFRSTITYEAKVRDSFYEALHLDCVRYKMTSPIILYGRLYEEERFQYVSVS